MCLYPGTQWTGPGGALDGHWTTDPKVIPGLIHLAVTGSTLHIHPEQIAAAWNAATDTQKLALGIHPDALADLNQSLQNSDPATAADAIRTAMASRDANSDTAKAAVADLRTQADNAADTTRLHQSQGTLPAFRHTGKNQYTVLDSRTGTILAERLSRNDATTFAAKQQSQQRTDSGNIQKAELPLNSGTKNPDDDTTESSKKPSRIAELFGSAFSKPPSHYTFKPSNENRPAILEIARETGIEIVQPGHDQISSDLRASARSIQERHGVEVIFFRAKGEKTNLLGFTLRSNPELFSLMLDQSGLISLKSCNPQRTTRIFWLFGKMTQSFFHFSSDTP